jgi:hypothetical protein
MFARVQNLSHMVGSAKKNLPILCIRQVQMCLQRYRSLSPVQNLCDTQLVMKSWDNLAHHHVSTATTTLASSELVSCNTYNTTIIKMAEQGLPRSQSECACVAT